MTLEEIVDEQHLELFRLGCRVDVLTKALAHYNTAPTDSLCSCGKCDPGKVAREALQL